MIDALAGNSSGDWRPSIHCLGCKTQFPESGFPHRCQECGELYDFTESLVFAPENGERNQSIWRYRKTLPIPPDAEIITLGEGNTPLVSYSILEREIYFKCEHLNPTGSFKDRGTSVLISAITSQGINRAVDDSSGNAGASFAAYAARAGLHAQIYIPAYTSGPKRSQMEAYGAEIKGIPGPRSAASESVLEAVEAGETYASHAHLPHGIAGMATAAFEIVEQLGKAPEAVITPVGQGTMLIGLGRGFQALQESGVIRNLPQLIAVQASACAPLWMMYSEGTSSIENFAEGETIAEGIRIKAPHRARAVLHEIQKSKGTVIAVDENEIKTGREDLARMGLYIEPTSAVVWPALNQLIERVEGPIVVIITGSGFKSPIRT
jgi:threonine synthase